MKTVPIEKQIELLRPAVKSGMASSMSYWMIGVAVALIILAAILWHPVPLMIAFFFGIVGFAERQSGPNIIAAIKAYDPAEPADGTARVWITCWDTDDNYHALLHENGQPDWEFEFIPQGWKPVEKLYEVRIWRECGTKCPPVLAVTDEGIMIPRRKPVLKDSEAGS